MALCKPSSVRPRQLQRQIQPAHTALAEVLCRHLGLRQADDDVHPAMHLGRSRRDLAQAMRAVEATRRLPALSSKKNQS